MANVNVIILRILVVIKINHFYVRVLEVWWDK